MRMTPGPGVTQLSWRWREASITAVVAVVLAVLGPFVWHKVHDATAGPDAAAPSCFWMADIKQANSDQAGLIRCYLKAIAQHDTSGLRSVVRAAGDDGPTGFTAADYSHAADALGGRASVTVTPNDSDSADATVSIRYADGAHESREIHLANPSSAHSWRFWDVGSYPGGTNAPAPALP